MKTISIFFVLFSMTSFAFADDENSLSVSSKEKWQCYSYHLGHSALIRRECERKAYEASQFLGKPAKCVLPGRPYCKEPGLESGTFAIVWKE